MKKIYKFTLIVLSIFLVLFFVGCDGSHGDPVFSQLEEQYIIKPNEVIELEISADIPDAPDVKLNISASGDLADYFSYNSETQQGLFYWEVDQTDIGVYSLTLQAEANDKETTATISIVVNNTPEIRGLESDPRVEDDKIIALAGTTIRVMVHVDDDDSFEGHNLSYSVSGAPFSNGVSTSNDFGWSTNEDDAGKYNVVFSVDDGFESARKSIDLIVNNPPVITGLECDPREEQGVVNVNGGELIRVMVHVDDEDEFEGHNLSYSVSGAPFSNGVSTSNDFSWNTGEDDTGTYEVAFEVNDGYHTDTASLRVVVE